MSSEASDWLFGRFDAPMEQLGKLLLAVPMFPVLSTVHFIMTAIALRSEPGSVEFAYTNPIASCVLHIMVAMSGTVLSDLMLGRPFFDFAKNESAVMTGVIIWYAMYHGPYNFAYRFCALSPAKFIFIALEELRRARNVMLGVNLALAMDEYKGCTLIPAVVGTIKGTGKKWSVSVYRILLPGATPGFELLNLSLITKVSFILALFYSSRPHYEGIRILVSYVMLLIIKLREMLTDGPTDFFNEPQAAIWSMLAYNWKQEGGEIQTKGIKPKEKVISFVQEEEVQSDGQKDIQSNEEVKEEEDNVEELRTEDGAGNTVEELQPLVRCRRRGTNTSQALGIAGDTGASVPDDGGDLDKTSG